ncbi:hypothetical protein BKA70DRAFT_1482387 [Coprinopsis sp. MPI-PUGE-AT-0042]|nr:hypothetical protein BKA70DRAFT_1482387 [Coprinopsis sp. MPI-PUGE-AT-0042]
MRQPTLFWAIGAVKAHLYPCSSTWVILLHPALPSGGLSLHAFPSRASSALVRIVSGEERGNTVFKDVETMIVNDGRFNQNNQTIVYHNEYRCHCDTTRLERVIVASTTAIVVCLFDDPHHSTKLNNEYACITATPSKCFAVLQIGGKKGTEDDCSSVIMFVMSACNATHKLTRSLVNWLVYDSLCRKVLPLFLCQLADLHTPAIPPFVVTPAEGWSHSSTATFEGWHWRILALAQNCLTALMAFSNVSYECKSAQFIVKTTYLRAYWSQLPTYQPSVQYSPEVYEQACICPNSTLGTSRPKPVGLSSAERQLEFTIPRNGLQNHMGVAKYFIATAVVPLQPDYLDIGAPTSVSSTPTKRNQDYCALRLISNVIIPQKRDANWNSGTERAIARNRDSCPLPCILQQRATIEMSRYEQKPQRVMEIQSPIASPAKFFPTD